MGPTIYRVVVVAAAVGKEVAVKEARVSFVLRGCVRACVLCRFKGF